MTQEQTNNILDEMLANPKSKTFLNHIIRSYMPISKVEKVFDRPTGEFKCALSKATLFSMQDILEETKTEEFKEKFFKSLVDIEKPLNSVVKELMGDRELGLTSKDTNTYLSLSTFSHFYDWVITKSLIGDKHINWLLGSIRRSSFIKRAENIQDVTVQTKVANLNKSNRATFSLGDTNDALAQLKAKMEADGY